MSKQTYRVCFCFRRRFRLTASEAPADIKDIFTRYSDNGVMTAEHLRNFLVDVQEEKSATLEDAQAIIDSLRHLSLFHRRGLNIEGFFKYLFGDANPPLSAQRGVIFSIVCIDLFDRVELFVCDFVMIEAVVIDAF